MWHMTCDTWHVTHYTQGVVNIASKFQVQSLNIYILFMIVWIFVNKVNKSFKCGLWYTKPFLGHVIVIFNLYFYIGILYYKGEVLSWCCCSSCVTRRGSTKFLKWFGPDTFGQTNCIFLHLFGVFRPFFVNSSNLSDFGRRQKYIQNKSDFFWNFKTP